MVNRGEEKVWVQMNVVARSTGNTNSGTRELTLKCKLKCYFKPMNNPLGVSPSKGKQGTTRGKEKSFDLGGNRTHDLRIRSTVTLGEGPGGPGGPGPPLFWVKKEEMTEGKMAGRASKSRPARLFPPKRSGQSGWKRETKSEDVVLSAFDMARDVDSKVELTSKLSLLESIGTEIYINK